MQYPHKLKFLKEQIVSYVKEIFNVYGNELILKLEDYNLLSSKNNCIETSTATGFIIEEFVTSKLAIYTNSNKKCDIKINKNNESTINLSYDCWSLFANTKVLINVKSEKNSSHNNGVAAINILHRDYCKTKPDQEKAYMVLKICYKFGNSLKDGQRKILITDVKSYFIEEADFSKGYKQDHRNWSQVFEPKSGRLQISDIWLKNHKIPFKHLCYKTTKGLIQKMFDNKIIKIKK